MAISTGLGSSALLPAGLGFRNKIINGGFDVNQRAFTSSTTNGGYGFDRWLMSADAGATYSAQTFTVGNAISGYEPTNFARIVTSGQTGGNYAQLAQRIEDVRTFAGQSVSISFWAKAASGTPKVAIELQQNFGSGGSPSGTVLTYVSQVTLSTSWTRYIVQATVPSISGKTLGSAGHYFSFAPFVSAGTGFESRTGSLGIQNNTFDFWGVQLEQNYQPTPFEQRPIGVELALCQRYYYRQGGELVYQPMGFGWSYSSTAALFPIYFPTKMRIAPVVESSTLMVQEDVLGGVVAVTAVTTSNITTTIGQIAATVASGLTQYRVNRLSTNNSLSGYLAFSAEL